MRTFCFKCRDCGARFEGKTPDLAETPLLCTSCASFNMVRDYRAESAAPLVANLRREREFNGARGAAELFLPTTKDFAGPSDPDGSKGLREWADRHGPRPSNKRPVYPEGIKRKSF